MSKKNAERSRAERAAEAVRAQEAAERRRRFIAIGSVVAVIALLIGGGFLLQNMRDTTGDEPAADPTVASNPADAEGTPGEVEGFGIFVGDADAPKTVTIYEDLQCPACAGLEEQLGDDLAAAVDDGKIRLEYRMISFLDNGSSNAYSSRALNSALVVLDTAGVDVFRTFHDDLYANQPAEGGPGPEDDELIARAVDAGADEEAIRGPIEDKVFDQWIKNATDQMSKDKVKATPTILIDGKKADPEELAELIQ